MSTVTERAPVTSEDRLSVTLCLAMVVHAIVILGVSFKPPPHQPARSDPLEVILVQQRSERPSPDAQFLAQANLQGSGEEKEKVSPASPAVAPFPDQVPKIALRPAPPAAGSPRGEALASDPSAAKPVEQPAETPGRASRNGRHRELAADTRVAKKPKTAPAGKSQAELARAARQPAPIPEPTVPDAAALISHSFAMASLQSEIDQRLEARAKRPRQKFVSAATREYKFAAYMEAWRAKVERIGNLNYPEEARRERITGDLILDVALKADGSIHEATIRRPSGYKVLDEAAVRIVRLAAPFAPFPQDISREVDILHITRSWQFLNRYRFASTW